MDEETKMNTDIDTEKHSEEVVAEEEKQEPETISISELQQEQMRKSLEDATEYKNKYLSALAELENTRKRLQKEKQEMMKFAVENVICDFLAPLDNIENAMGFTDQMSEETQNWVNGFKMLVGQLREVITQHGVTPFSCKGQSFDPYMHEAVEVEEREDIEEGVILEEFVKGYKIGDRIVRPAKVKVSKKINENKGK